jgi:hypothetical protein
MTRVARYAHSVTDADCEHILGLKKSYFQLRQNPAKKRKTMYDFFLLKKWFSRSIVSPHSLIVFSAPLKTVDRENTVLKYQFHGKFRVVSSGCYAFFNIHK